MRTLLFWQFEKLIYNTPMYIFAIHTRLTNTAVRVNFMFNPDARIIKKLDRLITRRVIAVCMCMCAFLFGACMHVSERVDFSYIFFFHFFHSPPCFQRRDAYDAQQISCLHLVDDILSFFYHVLRTSSTLLASLLHQHAYPQYLLMAKFLFSAFSLPPPPPHHPS